MLFEHTLLRGGEQRKMTLGALAFHENAYCYPLAAPVIVMLAHEGKENKENRAADNRCTTYGASLLGCPILHLGLHFLRRLCLGDGQPLDEFSVDMGLWCGVSIALSACSNVLGPLPRRFQQLSAELVCSVQQHPNFMQDHLPPDNK